MGLLGTARLVVLRVVLAGAACCGLIAAPHNVRAENYTLLIDDSQSTLTIAAKLNGPDLLSFEQSPGSLTAVLTGTVDINYSAGLGFELIGAFIDPNLNGGSFTPGDVPADFAGLFLSMPTSYFALRNSTWSAVGSGFYSLDGLGDYDANGAEFSITGGTSELQIGATVLPPEIAFLVATNGSSNGNLSQNGSQIVLNLPISATYANSAFTYYLSGNIVATATAVPEPSSLVLAGFAAAALGWKVRRRDRSYSGPRS